MKNGADGLRRDAKVVHIMAGTNDVAGNTGPGTPDDFKNNIRAIRTQMVTA
jgi:lysophospholipase L1-like esterase